MGNHWYTKTGESAYTIKGQNGTDRSTTLRDAKKFLYLPSVTTIIGLTAKPGLQNWIQDQLLLACMEVPFHNQMNENQWKSIVKEKSQKIGKDAADRGSEIHNALELFYKEGKIDDKHRVFIEPVIDRIAQEFPDVKDWKAEPSFASELGFGGKIDLVSEEHEIILDFKTKKDKAFALNPKTKKFVYPLKSDDYGMQLAAYGQGMGFVNAQTNKLMGEYYNLFISVETPYQMSLEEYDIKEVDRHWKMFYNLLQYWQLSNNYDSSFEGEIYNGN